MEASNVKTICGGRPSNDNEDPSCFGPWLQTPYDEGGAK